MTPTQVEWNKLQETKRNNVVVSMETNRHNIATENQQRGELAETQRHNLAGEQVAQGTLAETQRHNIASEDLTTRTLGETQRHNKATEKQAAKDTKARITSAKVAASATKSAAKQSAQAHVKGSRLSAEASKYGADQARKSSAFAATTSKEATLGSASIGAAATKYSSRLKSRTDKLLKQFTLLDNQANRENQKEIAQAKNELDRYIAILQDGQRYAQNETERKKIEVEIAKLEEAKRKNSWDIVTNMLGSISKGVGATGSLLGALGG